MIGNILVTLGLLAGVFTVVMYYLTYRGYQNTLTIARIGYHTTAIMIIASAALLLHAVLTHQYIYKYVYDYSGSGMSIGLTMSTFYAGQEGSFMLWTFFTAIIGLILLDYTSKRGDLEPRVMMIFTLSLSFLLIMISPLLKSPFNYIWMQKDFIDIKNVNQAFLSMPALQSFIFSDPQSNKTFVEMGKGLYSTLSANNISIGDFIIQGKGLNPLLQNFWMQIHPPMLFTGFSMSAVPFAFAMAAILKNEYRDWVKQALPWVLIGSCILGFAIMLGGYWAYGVLGWGGYWGWDPVENSSLVPWLVGVASIHTLLVQRKTQEKGGGSRFVKMNLILSIMTYVLVLYSTFLTRSGVLGDASVHSFVDPGMAVYLFLLIFLGIFILIGIGGIIFRWKYLTKHFSYEENILSRELALFTGSVALIATAIIVLAGTSMPIFGTTVQTSFYNELNLPLAIIIGLLNGLSILLKWKYTERSQLWNQSRFPVIATIILTALVVLIGGVKEVMLVALTFSSAFAFFVNGEIAIKILRGRKSHLGAYISHVGIALFLIGVLATAGHSKQMQVELIKGEKTNVLGHELTFTGYKTFDEGKKYHMNIEVQDGNNKNVIAPVMFVSDFNNSLMREPDILVGFTKDFYVAPLNYSDGSDKNNDGTSISIDKGETKTYNGVEITFNEFNFPPEVRQAMQEGKDFQIGAKLTVKYNGKTENIEPLLKSVNGNQEYPKIELKNTNLTIALASMKASGTVDLNLSAITGNNEKNKVPREVLTVEASIKPFISLVWIGILVMAAGFITAAFRRSKESLA